jgi:predicted Kef-type K+ transport protein
MSPVIKYTLARIGLFVVVFVALLPVSLDIFVKLLIALVASAGFSFILLRGLRDRMANEMAAAAERRKAEKERLRTALAGDDEPKRES